MALELVSMRAAVSGVEAVRSCGTRRAFTAINTAEPVLRVRFARPVPDLGLTALLSDEKI